eukprot:m.206483 g.206483  ORF g.206483 m.206483 type:complete len:88 (-) comp15025_c0_seq7:77-340(-)
MQVHSWRERQLYMQHKWLGNRTVLYKRGASAQKHDVTDHIIQYINLLPSTAMQRTSNRIATHTQVRQTVDAHNSQASHHVSTTDLHG